MNKFKICLKKFLFLLLTINPLLSLIFDNTTIYYHYLLLPIIFSCLVIIYFKKITKKKLILLFGIFLIFCFTFIFLLFGSSTGKINNHFFNFLDFVMLCNVFYDNEILDDFEKYFKKRKKIIVLIVFFINAIELYFFISKKGFVSKWNWGGTFFIGTSAMPHTLSYLMIVTIIYSYLLFLSNKRKYYLLFAILPFLFIFESGARVSLIMCSFLAIIFVDLMFSKKNDLLFFKFIKLFVFVSIIFLVFKENILESDLMSKINKRQSSGNNSAGRVTLWKDLINRFLNSPTKWITGFGDDKVYIYSGMIPSVNVNIWAHNDYIQILFGKGLVGIILYLNSVKKFVKNLLKNNGNLYSYFLILIYLIASILNGFYNYKDIMLALPFIFLLNKYLNTNRNGVENYE